MVEVVRVENRLLGRQKNEFVRNVVLPLQVSVQQAFVAKFDECPSEFTGQIHPPRLFLLLVVVCSRRT